MFADSKGLRWLPRPHFHFFTRVVFFLAFVFFSKYTEGSHTSCLFFRHLTWSGTEMFDLPRPKRCSSKSIFSLNRRPTLLLVLSLFVYVIHRVHTLATDPELMKMSDSLSVPASVRHWDVRLFGTHQQILGEGPFYDHARNRFYQVDIKGKKVIRLNLSSDVSLPVQFQHQTRNFSEVVSFVIPLQEPNGDLMVVGARNQILIYDFENDRIVRQLDFSNILKGSSFKLNFPRIK